MRKVGSKLAICEREWGGEVGYDVRGAVRELEKGGNGRNGGKETKKKLRNFFGRSITKTPVSISFLCVRRVV